jgi:hypothetical protein
MRKVKFSSKFENPRERKKCVKEVLCFVLFVRVLKERVTRNRESLKKMKSESKFLS